MSETKFQNTYRIPSARYPHHAYDGGMYFVTICAREHRHYFGKIDGEAKTILTPIGQFVEKQIQETKQLRKNINADIPMYVIMPNHIHLILFIDNFAPTTDDDSINKFGSQSQNVASIIRGIKSSVTGYARKNEIPFAWQERYHDRIIRDYNELNRIADYILNNPYNWLTDKYYSP